MSENLQADAPPGVAAMVGGVVEAAQKLFRQEIALAQCEVAQAWDHGKTAAALLASALVAFIIGGGLLGVMVAKLLAQLLPNHEWACFGIVGGLVSLLGGALAYRGLHRINDIHVSLPQSAETLLADGRADSGAVSDGRSSTDPLLRR